MSKMLNIEIKENAAREISKSDDNIVALAALDLLNSNLIPVGLDTRKWGTIMESSELYTENWLLAYEAYVKGWLPSASGQDYVSNDPFFGTLKANNVEFYKSISPLLPIPVEPDDEGLSEAEIVKIYALDLIQDEALNY